MKTAEPVERNVIGRLHPGLLQMGSQVVETLHQEGWVRLPSRPKILFHAEVNLHPFAAEPAPSPGTELRGLRHAFQAEQARLERLRFSVTSRRHRHLNMVES